MDIRDAVVALTTITERETLGTFLGTATYIGPDTFVTAGHVLGDYDGLLWVCTTARPGCGVPARLVSKHPELDLALLQAPGWPARHFFTLANDTEINHTQLVCCLEYSQTLTVPGVITYDPAVRLGNVTQLKDLTGEYGKAGDSMLVLSFPALKGASGAPVFSHSDNHLWGIVTANWSFELVPVQVETVLDEKGQLVEERKYLLPQALAIHVKHLRAILHG